SEWLPRSAEEGEEAHVLRAAGSAESACIAGVALDLDHGFEFASLGVIARAHQLFKSGVARLVVERRNDCSEFRACCEFSGRYLSGRSGCDVQRGLREQLLRCCESIAMTGDIGIRIEFLQLGERVIGHFLGCQWL